MITTENIPAEFTQSLIIDEEFKLLIPPLTIEELNGLENSILSEGCRDAIVTWNGVIIDGHNRYDICRKNGIAYKTENKTFENRDDVKIWIIRNQFARRNLTLYSRGNLSLVLKPLIASKAKENLVTHTKDGYQGCQNSDKLHLVAHTYTREEAINAAGNVIGNVTVNVSCV